MKTALVGARIIDGNGGDLDTNDTVIIQGSKILELTQQQKFGPDFNVIDVSGKTIMPGLIDTHVHFSFWAQWLMSMQSYPLSWLMSLTAMNMRSHLELGVTSARDMGGLEVGFPRAQAAGMIPGPRMHTCLTIIQATNGLTDLMPGVGGTITAQGKTAFLPGLPSPWANGVAEVRAKVREVLRFGADLVKCANSGVPWGSEKLLPDRPLFTYEELEALVDEAHRAGVIVCCHVIGYNDVSSTLDAIKAGADLIDHGSLLDEECVEEMAKRGTWYCPMFAIMDFHRSRNPNPEVHPIASKSFDDTCRSFELAVKAGVRICMGTDGGAETGWQGNEMYWMVENGMTPMEAIVTSTKRAAEAMRIDKLVGTLEPGKEADLLVVDGDPLQDVRIANDAKYLSLVMQSGKPVSGPLAAGFPYRLPDHFSFVTGRPIKITR
ncbi:MAG: amidohydrolase family protein [Anaerolineales bacterium]|nr:amidohydrolase family protein [Anaerolineales bacterium]